MSTVNPIVTAFPIPPADIVEALRLLAVRHRGDADEVAAAGNLENLQRPWDPATCLGELRESVWEWCDDVAAWLNHEFVWRPTQMVPPCWPQHPHIARELATLAVLRWIAQQSPAPDPMEEWHRYTFPMFCDRLADRLGESGCRTGRHVDWPAAARYAAFIGDHSGERQQTIYADTRPITALHTRKA